MLALGALITLAPFGWSFVTSLKFIRDINVGGWAFEPTLVNYQRLFSDESPFLQYMVNSLLVALVATTTAVLVGVPAANSLTRFRWPPLVSAGLLGWIVVVHAIPPVTLSGPMFVLVRSLGLYDQILGLARLTVADDPRRAIAPGPGVRHPLRRDERRGGHRDPAGDPVRRVRPAPPGPGPDLRGGPGLMRETDGVRRLAIAFRQDSPLEDETLTTLWRGFERALADRVPALERIVTPSWEDIYEQADWREFLRYQGYRAFTNRAFIKEMDSS